jgi:hypothetical protein
MTGLELQNTKQEYKMDLDCLAAITARFGVDMKFAVFMLIICVGTILWCILGIILEQSGVRNMWFMVAGFWFYPLYDFIYKTIMGYK